MSLRMPPALVWGILRISVGVLWLLESSLKFTNYYLSGGFAKEVAGVAGTGDPFPWYAYLIHYLFIPDAYFFGPAKTLAELAVGFCLVFGLAVPWACVLGIFMNLNFFVAAGWTGDVHYFVNLLLAFLEVAFIRLGAGSFWGMGEAPPKGGKEKVEALCRKWLDYLRMVLGAIWIWAAADICYVWFINGSFSNSLAKDLHGNPWTFFQSVASFAMANYGLVMLTIMLMEGVVGLAWVFRNYDTAAIGTIILCVFFFFASGYAEYLVYFHYAVLAISAIAVAFFPEEEFLNRKLSRG